MEEKKLTSLVFGNVVMESALMGAFVRIYSRDMRSYSMNTDRNITLKAPLDDYGAKSHPGISTRCANSSFTTSRKNSTLTTRVALTVPARSCASG